MNKNRKRKMDREHSWEFPKGGRGEIDSFRESRLSQEIKVEEYIISYGKAFNEFR